LPTAAKLVAAVAFAALAWVAAEIYKTTQADRTVWGQFSLIAAAVGGLCGWLVMGPLTGRGYMAAMSSGVRTSVTVLFWLLVGFAIYDMIVASTNLRYGGPMEALLGGFDLLLRHGRTVLTVEVLGTWLFGGILCGALAEWAGRQWR
jgi:hypothetical protein